MLVLLCMIVFSWLSFAWLNWRRQNGKGRVLVLVLGDAGRSPRMQYHCLSLVREGSNVDLVAYGGSKLIIELHESRQLVHHKLTKCSIYQGLPLIIGYFIKVVFQTSNLLWVILRRTWKPSHVVVQTPPSVPTLAVSVLVCYLRSSRLIIDYHNYGYTILALSLGNLHPLVKISRIYEKFLSWFAHSNICVSKAMQSDLRSRLGISSTVFYDRPPGRFKPAGLSLKHELFLKISGDNAVFRGDDMDKCSSMTVFTELSDGEVVMKKDRPFLIVSSTSWTEDEDFGILLEALEEYDTAADDHCKKLPKLVCVITGKGPLKGYYESIIQSKQMSHVEIFTLWLSAEDYPVLLGSADLGVCLHKSSSGLDLPMKVVDMFGCGLPVCAYDFTCLHELVIHDYNGMVFSTSSELCVQIQMLCCGFPDKIYKLAQYRENLCSFQSLRWEHNWRLNVFPMIKNM